MEDSSESLILFAKFRVWPLCFIDEIGSYPEQEVTSLLNFWKEGISVKMQNLNDS